MAPGILGLSWAGWRKRLKSALKNGSFRGFHGYIRFATTRYVVAVVVSPTDSVSFLEQGNYDSGKRSPRGLNVYLISSCCEISSLLMITGERNVPSSGTILVLRWIVIMGCNESTTIVSARCVLMASEQVMTLL
jgi:hypothetical protein